MNSIPLPGETYTGQPSKPETASPITVTERHLALLPAKFRRLVQLRSEGMKYEALALELGIPIGTVRSRLSRANRHMQVADDKISATDARAAK